MSTYHVGRIATFDGKINLSDWDAKPAEARRKAFLSRALAALCLRSIANVDETTASACIVDEFNDGGVDALYYDQNNDIFYFIQSKWSDDGSGSFDQAASMKFASGVRDILA